MSFSKADLRGIHAAQSAAACCAWLVIDV